MFRKPLPGGGGGGEDLPGSFEADAGATEDENAGTGRFPFAFAFAAGVLETPTPTPSHGLDAAAGVPLAEGAAYKVGGKMRAYIAGGVRGTAVRRARGWRGIAERFHVAFRLLGGVSEQSTATALSGEMIATYTSIMSVRREAGQQIGKGGIKGKRSSTTYSLLQRRKVAKDTYISRRTDHLSH